MNEATPQKLDELSSHTIVTGISDVDVTSIKVTSNEIEIQGTGSVEVDLEWIGGSSRDGLNIDTSFPLQFNIVLNKDLEIAEVREMEIDTSLFFE